MRAFPMKAYLYRDYFPWGRTAGYTDGKGRFGFIVGVWTGDTLLRRPRPRYYTPQRLARWLERTWRPQELRYWLTNNYEDMINYLRGLPPLE